MQVPKLAQLVGGHPQIQQLLLEAVHHGNPEQLELWLDQPYAPPPDDYVMRAAVATGQVKVLALLLEHGGKLVSELLWLAIFYCHCDMFCMLAKKGCPVEWEFWKDYLDELRNFFTSDYLEDEFVQRASKLWQYRLLDVWATTL
tara:strand:- start:81 stop:512 length:432 start_codon:yes stop_codon:yes gene_type:complete